jgi:hypothetical protein
MEGRIVVPFHLLPDTKGGKNVKKIRDILHFLLHAGSKFSKII